VNLVKYNTTSLHFVYSPCLFPLISKKEHLHLILEKRIKMHDDDFRPPSDEGGSDGSSNSDDSEIIPEEIGAPANMPSPVGVVRGPGLTAQKSMAAQHHRPRGNSVWMFQQVQGATPAAGNQHAAASSSSTVAGGVPRTARRRDIYEVEHALQYRTVMRNHLSSSKGQRGAAVVAQRTFGEELHIASVVHEYLLANGFAWAADAFRRITPIASSFAIPKDRNEMLDFHMIIAEEARRTSLLFDDDQPWRLDRLAETDISLVQVDAASQAAGGSIELLLEKLILSEKDPPYVDGKPDFNFTNIFLVLASLFVCPDVMLTYSMKLFKTISSQQKLLFSDARVAQLQQRLLSVLRSYLFLNSADFTVTALERLSAFCANASMRQHSKKSVDIASSISDLRTAVHEVVTNGTARRIGQLKPRPRPQHDGSLVPRFGPTAAIVSVLDIDDHELCRQICLLSFSLFERVHLRELLHNAWTDTVSLKLLTGNLTALIEFSTQFQYWVATTVVMPTDIETRRTVYRKWIRVCRALYNAQNYEMVNAVLEGLRTHAVHQLKTTIDGIESEEREELEGLMKVMDPFDNALQNISYHIDSPSIPVIASLLGVFYRAEDNGRTIVYLDAGNSSQTGNKPSAATAVNWSKIMQIAKPSFRWISFQSVRYPFHMLPNVQQYLWHMPGRLHPDRLKDVALKQRV
jgi:hypothetical protein